MPEIIGLDVALNKTGICLPDGSTLTSSGGQTTKGGDKRLTRLYFELSDLLDIHGVTHAIMEDLPMNAMGAGRTGMAQGVVRLALEQREIPLVTVVASTLKKYATGSGRADKGFMWESLPDGPRGLIKKTNDDETDAWWLWHMGRNHFGFQTQGHDREPPAIVDWSSWT